MKNKLNKHSRFEIIDVARGIAILLMFIYHFCYDLNYYGFIQENFNSDKFWILFRTIIVTFFLTIVGISLYLSSYPALNLKHFQRRLSLLIIYSALVSISSWIMFPNYMIFFGILHFIVVASLLGLLFIRLGVINVFLGVTLISLPLIIKHPFFDQPFLQWFGLMSHLPATVDYVPLLPWFGVVLIGIYLGQIIRRQAKDSFMSQWQARHPISKILSLGGRYSLHIYMLHQPLFLGILYIISRLIK